MHMSLLKMSIAGAVMILAITVIRTLIINKVPKKTFLILWGIALVRLLTPFSFPSALSIYSLLGKATAAVVKNTQVVSFSPTISAEQIAVMPHSEPSPTATLSIWAVAWLIGAALCALFFTVIYWKWRKEFQTSLPLENAFARKWLQAHPLRRSISIRQSDLVSAPLTYGVRRPIILMPRKTNWKNERALKYVLEHEFVHIQRFDALTKLLLIVAVCVHWFNPLVWIMYGLANRDIELSCDETVVHRFGEITKTTYANILIYMEETRSDFSPLCNHFSKNAIEERITSIMKMKKTSVVRLLAAAGLIVSVTLVFASSASRALENETAYLTEDAGGASLEEMAYPELLKEYEDFGITDEGGILYYKGEAVRFFLDGYEDEKGGIISRHTSFNEAGTVDVHTVRSDTKNEDGSTTLFGKISAIVPYTQEEFEARDVSQYRKKTENEEVTATEQGSDNEKTTAQYLKSFEGYGITYQKTGDNSGNIYWNGELAGSFWDKKPDGSIILIESELFSDVAVHTVYDENGKLVGISYSSGDTSSSPSASIQEDVMFSQDENGEIYYSMDGARTFMSEEEFQEKYPQTEAEWWTYEEYKAWLENEKVQLQSMIGEKAWTSGQGNFVWTQELVDESIAMYEEILKEIENGAMVSKTADDGTDDFMISYVPENNATVQEYQIYIKLNSGDEKIFGPYETANELLAVLKPFCDEQVRLRNMLQSEADEIIEKYTN